VRGKVARKATNAVMESAVSALVWLQTFVPTMDRVVTARDAVPGRAKTASVSAALPAPRRVNPAATRIVVQDLA